jgi:pyruvate kinase
MQGPELRIGRFSGEIKLESGQVVKIGKEGIPLDSCITERLEAGDELLLDDGKILAEVAAKDKHGAILRIIRGGGLSQRKSILIKGKDITLPAITLDDRDNLKLAGSCGITGIMQPFVRSKSDLKEVRATLNECGCDSLKIYAKIENRAGMENIRSFIDLCDEVIIARGDLGNSMPLWELPRAQKQISKICNEYKKPFMVVTQMLASMEKSLVPTRAEVSDIYNAVLDGASSVMVTGETAVGVNPAEVIRYLSNTVYQAVKYGIL